MLQRIPSMVLVAGFVAAATTSSARAAAQLRADAAASFDARAVLARAKEVTGGARWDAITSEHRVMSAEVGGLTGRAESWADVRGCRYVDRFQLGPMKGASGFDGKLTWSQDTSGQPRAEQGGDAREDSANEAFRRCLGYWFPQRWEARVESAGERTEGGRRFAVVRITPLGGRPYDAWFDQATGLLDREVEKTAMDTRTIFYSDYREVAGVKLPFLLRQTTGDPRYDQQVRVEKVTLDEPIDAAVFRMPAPPPPDFAIAGGEKSTSAPFELVNNHIYVDVKLDGRGPYRVLCDTGGANVMVPALAKELGIASQGALEGRGVGEKSEDTGLAKVRTLQLGGATLNDQLFYVMPLESMSDVEGVPVIGLVGYEVFRRFVVTIDYQRHLLRLTLPAAYVHDGKGTVVPFEFNGHVPQVKGTLDGIAGAFDLDTGSRSSLTVLAPFAEKHDFAARYPGAFEAVTGWGIGGPSRGKVTRGGVLTLGGVRIEKPVMDLAVQKKGAFVDPYYAGNVGGGVLRRFTLTFDYGHQQVIFEPNDAYANPDVYDRSGMWMNAHGDRFVVLDVVAGGPAAQAGLVTGDHIVAVDGRPAREVGLVGLRQRLKTDPPGTKLKLTVESSEGARRETTLTLRDLV